MNHLSNNLNFYHGEHKAAQPYKSRAQMLWNNSTQMIISSLVTDTNSQASLKEITKTSIYK